MLGAVCYTSFNRLYLTQQSLPKLVENTSKDTEIFVIDNGSDTETVSYLKAFKKENPRIKLVLNKKNIGVGGALNQVLSYIPDNYYFTKIDNDVEINTPNWDQWMMYCLAENPKIGVLGVHTYKDRPIVSRFRLEDGVEVGTTTYGGITGDFIMIGPALRKALGFFYEFTKYGYEDSELFYRIYLLNKLFCFVLHFNTKPIDTGAKSEYTAFKEREAKQFIYKFNKRREELVNTKQYYVNNFYNRKIENFVE